MSDNGAQSARRTAHSALPCGVRMAGVGSAVPTRVLTNADLSHMIDTTDEWIVQRTGIHQRMICDPAKGECELSLATESLRRALDDAQIEAAEMDLVIHASVTSEMSCPPNAARISNALGAPNAGVFDLVAACSGFVYSLNLADSLIRSGRHSTIGVIGCDALSTLTDYTDRTVSILFGDAAGAVVLTRDDDPDIGCMFQTISGDSSRWDALYWPHHERDIPEWDLNNPIAHGKLRMSGREVFKFAVTQFRTVITEALEATGLTVDDISQFVCHQSNARIIEASKQKLNLPDDKVFINIGEYGNSSAGSVGLVLDQLWKAGKIKRGDIIILVAFGGGLTWASNVWRV